MKKKFYFITLCIGFIWLTSCSEDQKIKRQSAEKIIESGDLALIKLKKTELSSELNKLKTELTLLDKEIERIDTTEKKHPLVTTFTVQDTVFNHYVTLNGTVETKQNIIIYPEMAGILTRVFVKKGQQVSKGQTLAQIDDGGLSQQLAQLQVQYSLAQTTFERQRRLWNQKIGSEIQYLQAKSNMDAQGKGIASLKDQIAKTTVRAPFSGVVDDVITEQGSVVAPGSSLFRLINLSNMYISTEVPENYLPSVTKGTFVEVHFPVLNETMTSSIRQVDNYINPNNRSFIVEIDVPNKQGLIKPNLTASLRINDYSKEHAILIPQNIISEEASGQQYVYLVKENKASKQIIITGKSQDEVVEVVSGLSPGDAIINEGARSVRDGVRVDIKPS